MTRWSRARWIACAAVALAGCVESAYAQSRGALDGGADARRGTSASDAGHRDGARGRAGGSADARRARAAMGMLRLLTGPDGGGGVLGAFSGAAVGDALDGPSGGLGLRGTGLRGAGGGGGTGVGTIGVGALGNVTDAGSFGVGGLGGRLTMRGPPNALRVGAASQEGAGLPPEVIRRIVRRNIGAIRLCFDRAGAADAGVLAPQVRFVIKPDGLVSDVPADLSVTGAPPDVAQCLADSVRRMQFPAPSDGSRVRVVYPFTFDPHPAP